MIRAVHLDDAQELVDIYNYYVLNTVVTFDVDPLSLEMFEAKIKSIQTNYPFIVFEANNDILGYAYGSLFRPHSAYSSVVEATVYVKHDAKKQQIGTQLYAELLTQLIQKDFHTVLGVLTVPNEASIKLHEKFGFEKVAHLKEVGYKFDTWQHVGIWQLKLN